MASREGSRLLTSKPARMPEGGSKLESVAAAAPPASATTGKSHEAGKGKGAAKEPSPAASRASDGDAKTPAAAASAAGFNNAASGAEAMRRATSATSTPAGAVTSLDSQARTSPRIAAPSARATAEAQASCRGQGSVGRAPCPSISDHQRDPSQIRERADIRKRK